MKPTQPRTSRRVLAPTAMGHGPWAIGYLKWPRLAALWALPLAFSLQPSALLPAAPLGTAFTYQGRLSDAGVPAQGGYDIRFTIYDALASGNAVGTVLTNAATPVSSGLFAVTLDFGPGVFTGDERCLEIAVRTNGSPGDFTILTPRQPITSAPHALIAASALNALTASNVVPGAVSAPQFNTPGAPTAGQVLAYTGSTLAWTNAGAAAGAWLLGGNSATAPGPQFLGTADNQALELKVNGQRALRLEPQAASPSIIGGYSGNRVPGGIAGATIGGGGGNGAVNSIAANYATIAGGLANTVQTNAGYAAIAGGRANTVQSNTANATIGGGLGNTVQTGTSDASIGGGNNNVNGASYATLGGGSQNAIQTSAQYATIAGGLRNTVQTNASYATVGGGYLNAIHTNAQYAVIGGGNWNTIQSNAQYATIAGGTQNRIQTNCHYAAIAGGFQNSVLAPGAAIGGGGNNTVHTNAVYSTIAGGSQNTIQGQSWMAAIGGGAGNIIQREADTATIGGGSGNIVQYFALNSTIGGGWQNAIHTNSQNGIIGGGRLNTIQSNALYGAIAGGYQNSIQTNSRYATVSGGYFNSAGGQFSFAAGRQAKALHDGAFLWADSTAADFTSTSANQFLIRASGGVGIGTTAPGNPLTVEGVGGTTGGIAGQADVVGRFRRTGTGTTAVSIDALGGQEAALYLAENGQAVWDLRNAARTVGHPLVIYHRGAGGPRALLYLYTNGNLRIEGQLSSLSDRERKENWSPVDPRQILAQVARLPIGSWNYKGDAVTHLGPTAQDFHAGFGVGGDDKHISTVDADGVALAAIQGLNQEVDARSRKLEAENATLKQELAELKALVQTLAEKVKGGEQ